MLNVFIEYITIVGYLILAFVAAWLANFCFSLFYNLAIIKEGFSWKKFFTGILKLLILVVGIVLIVLVITIFPEIVALTGLTQYVEIATGIGIAAIFVPFIYGIYKYLKDGVTTFTSIFNNDVIEMIDAFDEGNELEENAVVGDFAEEYPAEDLDLIDETVGEDTPKIEG